VWGYRWLLIRTAAVLRGAVVHGEEEGEGQVMCLNHRWRLGLGRPAGGAGEGRHDRSTSQRLDSAKMLPSGLSSRPAFDACPAVPPASCSTPQPGSHPSHRTSWNPLSTS
jgi:hypothetical protein